MENIIIILVSTATAFMEIYIFKKGNACEYFWNGLLPPTINIKHFAYWTLGFTIANDSASTVRILLNSF